MARRSPPVQRPQTAADIPLAMWDAEIARRKKAGLSPDSPLRDVEDRMSLRDFIAGAKHVFVVENNEYAISTHYTQAISVPNISMRALGFGLPGVTIDGRDFNAVCATAAEAVERARRANANLGSPKRAALLETEGKPADAPARPGCNAGSRLAKASPSNRSRKRARSSPTAGIDPVSRAIWNSALA